MSAEGTLPIGPLATSGIRVTSRAPLPSSSTSRPERIAENGNPEAEGRALTAEQTGNENRLSVPGAGLAQSPSALVPSEREQPGNDEAIVLSGLFGSPIGLAESPEKEVATEVARAQERERLARLSEEINAKINERLTVRFKTDEETGVDLFQLVEQETGEVVRQIPSEEILAFLRKFQDTSGLLFSEQA